MRKPLLALACLLLSLPALANDVKPRSFRDADGQKWTRWVLSEKRPDGALLLVVEAPQGDARASAQRVLLRRFFGDARSPQIAPLTRHYAELADQPQLGRAAPGTQSGTQPLWTPVREQWTQQDEDDYTAWYAATVNAEYLVGTGLAVDCADLPMTLRWIYAHDRKLPVANTLAGSGRLLGHWSTRADWDALPTHDDWRFDQRFRAALRHLLSNAYTHSIERDLYPTQLTRDFVRPGSVILNLYSNTTGHTQVVHSTARDDDFCGGGECLQVLYGNEPANERVYRDSAWIVNVRPGRGGLLRWRWPQRDPASQSWSLAAHETMPGFSMEQYGHPEFSDSEFRDFLHEKLELRPSEAELLFSLGQGLLSQLSQRVDVTRIGHFYCHVQACAPDSADYDHYSTPSRDARFREAQLRFLDLLSRVPADHPTLLFLQELAGWPIAGQVTAWDYLINRDGISDRMSADPTQSYFARWALPELAPLARAQTLLHNWTFAWYHREEKVTAALRLCRASWDPSMPLTCDPNAAEVRALATHRLDGSLRRTRAEFRDASYQLPDADRDALREEASWSNTNAPFCGAMSEDSCTIEDLLLTRSNLVERMSSDPTATFPQRYGAPARR